MMSRVVIGFPAQVAFSFRPSHSGITDGLLLVSILEDDAGSIANTMVMAVFAVIRVAWNEDWLCQASEVSTVESIG